MIFQGVPGGMGVVAFSQSGTLQAGQMHQSYQDVFQAGEFNERH